MNELNQQAPNYLENASKILSVGDKNMNSKHNILLEAPPEGFHATSNLRWVRSAAQGGTVLVQQYQSIIEIGKTVWCVIQHGLPDSNTTHLHPMETTDHPIYAACLPQLDGMLNLGVSTETAMHWSDGITLLVEHYKHLVEVIENQIGQIGDKEVLHEAAMIAKDALKILKVLP